MVLTESAVEYTSGTGVPIAVDVVFGLMPSF
jgi:hypothetical protein